MSSNLTHAAGKRFTTQGVSVALALVAAAVWLGVSLLRLYSPPSPWTPFAYRTREFLRAAVARDSIALAQLAASPATVRWALDAAARPASPLAGLVGFRLAGGSRGREGTVIYIGVDSGPCKTNSYVAVQLVGSGADARVQSILAPCLPSP